MKTITAGLRTGLPTQYASALADSDGEPSAGPALSKMLDPG
jgi:hypothetical protein